MPDAPAPDVLETILAATRRIVESRRRRCPDADLERRAAAWKPRGDRFAAALAGSPGRPASPLRVIAECKRRSPSRGVLRADYDPAAVARGYERAGAVAISVLTEPTFFDGALDHLTAVRQAVQVPVLRKDFIVTEYQLLEARAAGADAVLLIAAALEPRELRRLLARAAELGLAALVEVHDEIELSRALEAEATMIGVNNRNLRTLEVDVDASRRLAPLLPRGVTAVAESGLRHRSDLMALAEAGYAAFLIGERFMTAEDPGRALEELLGGAEARAPRRACGQDGR
ncbi:MAG TPA: indole-3-glycerol phosphate synthase TrpC [Vicinamibacterales bacterium]|nr:indole-3-glycerol phosphate synthase TrpC [Vicinamibacterales bacterium]